MAANSKSDKSKSADKKVFDVAKPGKSAPSTTTRPIILGHKPMIQDPMVNTSEASAEAPVSNTEQAVPVRGTKKIMPLSEKEPDKKNAEANKADGKPAEEPAANSDAKAEVAKAEDTLAPDSSAEEQPSSPNVEAPETVPDTNEKAAVDALANQVTRRKDGELSEEEIKRAEAIQKLITDKTYYLKIGQAHRGRNNTLFIILFLVVIVAAGLMLAVDAGIVQTNITLPFDLISN